MKSLFYWFLVFLYCCVIFYYSSQPVVPQPGGVAVSSWILHFVEFFILSALVFLAFDNTKSLKKNAALYTIIFVTLYAISDELHQMFVPGRVFSLIDIFTDFSSSVVFVVAKFILFEFKN